MGFEIHLADPRGFCAGVERAITIVDRVLEKFGAPVYVRHEVVHNRFVVDGLKAKGAIFIENLEEVPDGATLIFSAHGVPKAIRHEADARSLQVFDATCPLVTKVHLQVDRMRSQNRTVIMIGHKGHPEVEGTMGQSEDGMCLIESARDVERLDLAPETPLAYVTQTTLSVDDAMHVVDALRERYPEIVGPKKDDICYATQSRQEAVKLLAEHCDLVLVVGSTSSSNSNRLREVAERSGAAAYLVDSASDLNPLWWQTARAVGVTAGASAPEVLVDGVIARLESAGGHLATPRTMIGEGVSFPLPRALETPA